MKLWLVVAACAAAQAPLAMFVSPKDLLSVCRKIISDAKGRPRSVEPVCLNEMKAAIDGLVASGIMDRPHRLASTLLDQCEAFHQFVTTDGAFSVAPQNCGKLIMQHSALLNTPLIEFVPRRYIAQACETAIKTDNCEMAYDRLLTKELGILSMTKPLCEELKTQRAAVGDIESAHAFCVTRTTRVATISEAVDPLATREPHRPSPPSVSKEFMVPVGEEASFGSKHWSSDMHADPPFRRKDTGASLWSSF